MQVNLPMSTKKNKQSGLVYSTGHGRMFPDCGKPVSACRCRQKNTPPKSDGIVRVGRETKGRKGKGMTIITGVPLHPEGIQNLARELKQTCGTGGTVKNGIVEIQGDHRDLLVEELKKHGWTVKRSGG